MRVGLTCDGDPGAAVLVVLDDLRPAMANTVDLKHQLTPTDDKRERHGIAPRHPKHVADASGSSHVPDISQDFSPQKVFPRPGGQ